MVLLDCIGIDQNQSCNINKSGGREIADVPTRETTELFDHLVAVTPTCCAAVASRIAAPDSGNEHLRVEPQDLGTWSPSVIA
jgi:hypothetical protein